MKTLKNKRFDAVAASRRWRARSSRELAGLTYEQLQVRLSNCASAETLLRLGMKQRGRARLLFPALAKP